MFHRSIHYTNIHYDNKSFEFLSLHTDYHNSTTKSTKTKYSLHKTPSLKPRNTDKIKIKNVFKTPQKITFFSPPITLLLPFLRVRSKFCHYKSPFDTIPRGRGVHRSSAFCGTGNDTDSGSVSPEGVGRGRGKGQTKPSAFSEPPCRVPWSERLKWGKIFLRGCQEGGLVACVGVTSGLLASGLCDRSYGYLGEYLVLSERVSVCVCICFSYVVACESGLQ